MSVTSYLDSRPGGPFDIVFCDPPFADVAMAEVTLAHEGLRSAMAPGGLLVVRAHAKHVPALPASLRAARVKEIGEEKLLFLRYSHTAAGG
jgi:16S rRNA G966 N2-methylase RsmD